MLHALFLAVDKAEPDKTAFYIVGGALAVWAVVLGLLGLRQPEFPSGQSAARGVMTISIVLVAGAIAAGIGTS